MENPKNRRKMLQTMKKLYKKSTTKMPNKSASMSEKTVTTKDLEKNYHTGIISAKDELHLRTQLLHSQR